MVKSFAEMKRSLSVALSFHIKHLRIDMLKSFRLSYDLRVEIKIERFLQHDVQENGGKILRTGQVADHVLSETKVL